MSHSDLLVKLPLYGVQGKELDWFTDYLYLRKQIVQFKGTLSESRPVFAGVPQGSILRPLLFLIHFNDAYKALKTCKIMTYADDTVVFTSSRNIETIQTLLNQDTTSLSNWFNGN